LANASVTAEDLEQQYASVPFGLPKEPLPSKDAPGIRIPLYGFNTWAEIFTSRQLSTLATFVKSVRKAAVALTYAEYNQDWREGIWAFLALANDRLADYGSALCSWHNSAEKLRNTFGRFALPIVWDFTETNPFSGSTGDYSGALEWVAKVADRTIEGNFSAPKSRIQRGSALQITGEYDAIVTDPPYYDAIPYSDLMDFFYVWLRRTTHGLSPEIDDAFAMPLGPKWNHEAADGELIDDASRFGGDKAASKKNFEDGMGAVFRRCHASLVPGGIMVIVFANKNPDAWETLVGALIRAGFVVDGSLPIQTEMSSRTRGIGSAALSSSVWLVCRKRAATARPGFAIPVLTEMREKVRTQMHRFWDAGIRGPDFVWAATGPALEAYSRHPIVRRETSASGQPETLPVSEFLREVRRLVVEFAVGRVLKPAEADGDDAVGLDEVTRQLRHGRSTHWCLYSLCHFVRPAGR
jgi:adenine-specific DNA methylase